ncbi:MAG: ABC transporter permease [Clostridiales bacterium]|jgi:simple sugar transport system permease protein|nr:ABC transporter permease [Clostridiales bacterium]
MMAKKFELKKFLSRNIVPIIFLVMTAVMLPFSGYSGGYLAQEIVHRLSRDAFLVLALLVPLMAGMGINFGLGLGAMASQIALIFVTDWHIGGVSGLLLAMLVSIPISLLFGFFGGYLINNAKGREMITSYVLGFFMLGAYQVIVLFGMGKIIPITERAILLPRGYGIRGTIPLERIAGSFDNLVDKLVGFRIHIGDITIPLFTILVVALLCFLTWWFRRTKFGQEIRAVGQDMSVAAASGINVGRTRIISMLISTVLAGFGYIIFMQNVGVLPVYTGANTVALYAAAALLVGGATAKKAGLPSVIFGIALFHLLFIVTPMAANRILGNPAVAEYFRLFISYSIIAIALVMNGWNARKERDEALFGHRRHIGNTSP